MACLLTHYVQDATATLNLILKHPKGKKNHARLLFVHCYSTSHVLQPHLHQFHLETCAQIDARRCESQWSLP